MDVYSAYGLVSSAVGAVSSYWQGSKKSSTSAIADHYYDPILTLFELAMIPLDKRSKTHNIRLYYLDVITRCRDTFRDKAYRTVSSINPLIEERQERVQAQKLIPVIVRAIRWYNPADDSEINQAVRFLFRQAIIGLSKYEETYSEGTDKDSRRATEYIRKARNFLTLELKEYGDQFEKIADRVREELDECIKKQKKEEKILKANDWYIDSRKFWVTETGEDGVKPFDEIIIPINEMMELCRLKNQMELDPNPIFRTKYTDRKKKFEDRLKVRQDEFVKYCHK